MAMATPADSAPKRLVKHIFGSTAHTNAGARADAIITGIQQHVENLASSVDQAWEMLMKSSLVRSHCPDEQLVLGKFRDDQDVFAFPAAAA